MLKIKDNVDLKVLEKYGFKYSRMIYIKDTVRNRCNLVESDE